MPKFAFSYIKKIAKGKLPYMGHVGMSNKINENDSCAAWHLYDEEVFGIKLCDSNKQKSARTTHFQDWYKSVASLRFRLHINLRRTCATFNSRCHSK